MLHHELVPTGTDRTRLPLSTRRAASIDRWLRVAARDRSADGLFFYAVTSTGVFCRPSCPSRRPRPDRVRFFDTAEAAMLAGFRPCRRCRPTEASSAATPMERTIQRVARYLASHVDEPLSLTRLGALARVSPSHLQRQFKRVLGVSPREYQAALRARRFRDELKAGRDVAGAIYEAGYGSPSRVYEGEPTGGMTPRAYRRGGAGEHVGYTIVPCALGRLLVAATERGICAVKLGDRDEDLERELRTEFAAATVERDRMVRPEWIAAVVSRLTRDDAGAAIPLDVRGTAFQWRVWRALERIPRGQTRSYTDIARAIGQPDAVRAVARACATNPVAIVVPCHRVVSKNGGLGGYRWGEARKRALLREEETKKS